MKKSKVQKSKAGKVENISLPDFLDIVKVPKKVKNEMVKNRIVTGKKNEGALIVASCHGKPGAGMAKKLMMGNKSESTKRTAKSKPEKAIQAKKTKGMVDRQKGTLAKEDKKKKGKPKKVRGSGRLETLADYFFDRYYDHTENDRKFPLVFVKSSADFLPNEYPYFIMAIRPCKLTVKKIINENGFNPYDDTKEKELCIFETLVFSDELSGADADIILSLDHFTLCKANLVVFHSKEQVDAYLAKVGNKGE